MGCKVQIIILQIIIKQQEQGDKG